MSFKFFSFCNLVNNKSLWYKRQYGAVFSMMWNAPTGSTIKNSEELCLSQRLGALKHFWPNLTRIFCRFSLICHPCLRQETAQRCLQIKLTAQCFVHCTQLVSQWWCAELRNFIYSSLFEKEKSCFRFQWVGCVHWKPSESILDLSGDE